jgi:hypothetical protein
MNENIQHCELSERMTLSDKLAALIDFARDAMTLRLGYEVEIVGVEIVCPEPIERKGHSKLHVYWRRKSPVLRVVNI